MTLDATTRRSPLEGVPLTGGLRELPFLAQVDLRFDPANAPVASALVSALGFGLPVEPNTVAGSGDLAALWLGPDEWLVVGPPGRETELELVVRAALGGAHGSVVDVSANRTTLELSGPDARRMLESGCPIDLHPRSFGPGRCAQTLLARANVVLWQTAAEPRLTYRILVRPSFAAYVAAWLADAADGIEGLSPRDS
jgi:sarcosine oxidase subunit gamma